MEPTSDRPSVLEATIIMVGTIDGKTILGLSNGKVLATVQFDGPRQDDWAGQSARVRYSSQKDACTVELPGGRTCAVEPALYKMYTNDSRAEMAHDPD